MKKFLVFVLSWIVLVIYFSPLFSVESDQVESLIESEQKEEKEWVDSEGDLPPVFLNGDQTGIEIYSPALNRSKHSLLCTDVEFDELTGFNDDPLKPRNQIVLDIGSSAIRESLSLSCLLRPSDEFLAIGPGWQNTVTLDQFVVKQEQPLCPSDPPYSLWVLFKEELPGEPLFFSSDNELPMGANQFRSLEKLAISPLDAGLKSALAKEIEFIDEYKISVYEVEAKNCDHLLVFKRETVGPEDNDLPNEMVLTEEKGNFEIIQMEKVNTTKASGHVEIEGVLDYNGDGWVDLLLQGTHAGCFYRAFFEGQEKGFKKTVFPIKCSG